MPKRPEGRATFTPHTSRLKQSLVLAGMLVFIVGFVLALGLATGVIRWGLPGLEGRWVAPTPLQADATQPSDELTVRFGENSTVYYGGPTKIQLYGTLAGERFLCVADVSDWSVVSQKLSLDDEERWRTVERDNDRLVVTDASGATVTLRFASD